MTFDSSGRESLYKLTSDLSQTCIKVLFAFVLFIFGGITSCRRFGSSVCLYIGVLQYLTLFPFSGV